MKTGDADAASTNDPFETTDEAVRLQYDLLGILDSKASALLTFNAVALASIAVWLAYVSLNYLHLALDLVFILLLISCACLLAIIALRWAHPNDDPSSLNAIRLRRTSFYRAAWVLSIGSIACLIIITAVHTAGTLLIATDNCGDACTSFFSEDVFGNLDTGRGSG